MSSERATAIVVASTARAMIRAMGMQAENQIRVARGEAPAYAADAFEKLIVEEGIGWNGVINMLNQYGV
jgi:hypothetical protein